MKKYYSVFSLYIRKDFWKFIILLAALFAAYTFIYLHGASALQAKDFRDVTLGCAGPLALVFLLSFISLAFIRSSQGKDTSSCGYTLGRLRISERSVFWMSALANTFYFLILWLAAAIMTYLCLYRLARLQGQESSYSWLAALLCGDGFLHGLIPMADRLSLIRNIVYSGTSGIACAALTVSSRHHERIISPVILLAILIWSFSTFIRTSFWSITFGIFALIVLALTIAFALDKAHDGRRAHED